MKIIVDGPDSSILLIEDSDIAREIILGYLKSEYPLSKIYAPKNLFEEDVETVIKNGKYSYIFLDPCLAKWGCHPIFGEWSESMIPFIKKESPDTHIVFMSDDEEENLRMTGLIQGEGVNLKKADSSIKKSIILYWELVNEFK